MVVKIISGGQTGVDRAGLDFAIEHGIEHGGFCPKGRRAVDGMIPLRYKLEQTRGANYAQRTEKNLLCSDGTLILYSSRLTGGTALTRNLCRRHGRCFFMVDMDNPDFAKTALFANWVRDNNIKVLNIAGPRENAAKNIYPQAKRIISDLFDGICD